MVLHCGAPGVVSTLPVGVCEVQKFGWIFSSISPLRMSAIKTVCSVCQFILSVTLLAQVGIIKISWFAWFAHSHGESKTWKGFTVL